MNGRLWFAGEAALVSAACGLTAGAIRVAQGRSHAVAVGLAVAAGTLAFVVVVRWLGQWL